MDKSLYLLPQDTDYIRAPVVIIDRYHRRGIPDKRFVMTLFLVQCDVCSR